MICFYIFLTILLFFEVLLMSRKKEKYFKDYHNCIDLLIIISLFLLVTLDWIYNHNRIMMYFHFFGTLFIGFRILLEIRIFKHFRHLT